MRAATARTCPVISSPARRRSRCMPDAASSSKNTSILLSSHVRLGTWQVSHPPATEPGYPARPAAATQCPQPGIATGRSAGAQAPLRPDPAIMDSVPETPGQQTRTAATRRIIAHVTRGWPRLGEPTLRHRGRFCYVSALLPAHREPTPILRLRYQGSADRWAIGIYLASSGQYTESDLPASFGPKTGTPEEGVHDTFILYADPKTGHLRP